MSRHDKVFVQARAALTEHGWWVSITAPTFDTGDAILASTTCTHKSNVAKSARELASLTLGVPLARVNLNGVDYQ